MTRSSANAVEGRDLGFQLDAVLRTALACGRPIDPMPATIAWLATVLRPRRIFVGGGESGIRQSVGRALAMTGIDADLLDHADGDVDLAVLDRRGPDMSAALPSAATRTLSARGVIVALTSEAADHGAGVAAIPGVPLDLPGLDGIRVVLAGTEPDPHLLALAHPHGRSDRNTVALTIRAAAVAYGNDLSHRPKEGPSGTTENGAPSTASHRSDRTAEDVALIRHAYAHAALARKVDQMRARAQAAEAERDVARAHVETLLSSTSWRVLEPARWATRLARRLRGSPSG